MAHCTLLLWLCTPDTSYCNLPYIGNRSVPVLNILADCYYKSQFLRAMCYYTGFNEEHHH